MLPEEVINAIRKGIPNYVPIKIDINTLIHFCDTDKDRVDFLNAIRKMKKEYTNTLIDITNVSKYNNDFFKSLIIYTDYQKSLTVIQRNPEDFLKSLKEILNVTSSSLDFNDEELKKELYNKVNELHFIKTPEELKEKFPLIYEDYEKSMETYPKVLRLKGKDTYSVQKRYYDSYGFDTRFNEFIIKQTYLYKQFVKLRQFVEGYDHRNPLNMEDFPGINKDKFELYLASKYLEAANSTDNLEVKQECVYYLTTYIREVKSSRLKITNENGRDYSFISILRGYKKLLVSNPTLKPIDEERSNFVGYHYKHVKNHVNYHYKNMVNWFIAPAGYDDIVDDELSEQVRTSLNRQYNYLSKEAKEAQIKKAMAMYDRKIKFYNNSGCLYRIMGLNEFDGYIAYVYPNGKIILDRLFDDYLRAIPAVDNALYIMDVDYFETLSQFNKQELIKSELVTRKYHSGEWEDRVRTILDGSVETSESKDKVLELKNKFKIK